MSRGTDKGKFKATVLDALTVMRLKAEGRSQTLRKVKPEICRPESVT